MSASSFCGVIDFNQLDSGPGSPNVEGEFFSWGLERKLVKISVAGILHPCTHGKLIAYSIDLSLRLSFTHDREEQCDGHRSSPSA